MGTSVSGIQPIESFESYGNDYAPIGVISRLFSQEDLGERTPALLGCER